MSTSTPTAPAEVLVVGAGPAGLTLAVVLADHGVPVRLVDRKAGPVEESRAAIVHTRTLELWDKLGVADAAIARGTPTRQVEVRERGRHVAGFSLSDGDGAGSPFPYALALGQGTTERLLVAAFARRGGHPDWKTEVDGLEPADDGVRVDLQGPSGPETVTARFVVGADGAASFVRHALGLDFEGATFGQTGLLADVVLDGPGTPPAGMMRLNLTRGGFVGLLPLPGGVHRLFGAVPPEFAERDERDERDEVSHEAYARVSSRQIQEWFDTYFVAQAHIRQIMWSSLFRVHSRIAPRLRVGGVFLVGDAAHVHSPAGGQGMNLAVGDAYNLGWKLALVITGRAQPALLDSYEQERLPIAQRVLRCTDRGFALEATSNPAAAWIRAHLAGRVLGFLSRLHVVRSAIVQMFAQTWISYPDSPAVARTGGTTDQGPRPGDRAPHVAPETGSSTQPVSWNGPSHQLLLFEGTYPDPALPAHRLAVEEVLGWSAIEVQVHVVEARWRQWHERYGATGPRLVLVRPDGHVAFAGGVNELGALRRHLQTLYRDIGADDQSPPPDTSSTASGT